VAHSDALGQSSPLGPPPHSSGPSEVPRESGGSAAALGAAPIRVLLAMAAEFDRMAWSIVLNNQSDMELIAATSSSRQLLRLLKLHAPGVVLLDETLLALCAPGALAACARKTACRFVLIAMHPPDYSLEPPSLESSPASFIHARLLKGVSAPDLLQTLRAVAAG
jgi:DNA-binding NarL/FixJ family response regulator